MATVEVITLTDSLDPRISNGVETVTFFHPVFGTKHEVELSEKNREHFAAHLAKLDKYIDASREVVEEVKSVAKATATKSDLTVVREWAKAKGYTVGDRGRIKAEILEAYDAAQMPTAVEGGKVILTVAPEAQAKLDEIAADKAEQPVAEVEVAEAAAETQETAEPISSEDFLALMEQASTDGEVTMEKLAEVAAKA